MIEIINLHVSTNGSQILNGINLKVPAGEVHVIMGPNGTGKSTLAKVIAGDPSYEITEGKIYICGLDVAPLQAEERAHLGLFIGFQYPIEISGVSNLQFLHASYNSVSKARGKPELSEEDFLQYLKEKMSIVEMSDEFNNRSVNEGLSGGEKKRNEILQMAVLDPKVAVLDETDSGLDIDALRIVARGVNNLMSPDKCLLLITHYQRLLNYIKPDVVHVMLNGKIVKTGDASLALDLESRGYNWLYKEAAL